MNIGSLDATLDANGEFMRDTSSGPTGARAPVRFDRTISSSYGLGAGSTTTGDFDDTVRPTIADAGAKRLTAIGSGADRDGTGKNPMHSEEPSTARHTTVEFTENPMVNGGIHFAAYGSHGTTVELAENPLHRETTSYSEFGDRGTAIQGKNPMTNATAEIFSSPVAKRLLSEHSSIDVGAWVTEFTEGGAISRDLKKASKALKISKAELQTWLESFE